MNVVLIKNNGKTVKYDLQEIRGTAAKINDDETLYSSFLDNSKNEELNIKALNTVISGFIRMMKDSNVYLIERLFNILKEVDNESNLGILFEHFMQQAETVLCENKNNPISRDNFLRVKATLINYAETNPKLFWGILCKRITYVYLSKKVETSTKSLDLINFIKFIEDNDLEKIEEFLKLLNINFKTDNGMKELCIRTFEAIIRSNSIASQKHLCSDCANLTPLRCSKVEKRKHPIDSYTYIKDGYQEFGEVDGRMKILTFIVSNCRNYSKDLPRKKK